MADNRHRIDADDDRTAVDRLRTGDERCYDTLFRRYYKPLCTYAARFVAPERAEELVQDTFMWMWEHRRSLSPDMSVKSLLFTIVRNKSINSAARNARRRRIVGELAERYAGTFDDPDLYLEGELMSRLEAALERMPESFRETFRMHRLEGMTHRQIAEALHVSPQTVNYRIGQTLRLLRTELKECLPAVAAALLFGSL